MAQLIEVVEHWTSILDSGGSIDVPYLHVMKAFDTYAPTVDFAGGGGGGGSDLNIEKNATWSVSVIDRSEKL